MNFLFVRSIQMKFNHYVQENSIEARYIVLLDK